MKKREKDEHNQPLVDASGIATYLNISERTVRKWTQEGKLPHRRLGYRTVRYSIPECLEELQKYSVTTT